MQSTTNTFLKEQSQSHEGLLFSLVLPCYREGAHLCGNVDTIVETLERQFQKGEYEIILINDGSPDDTEQKCRKIERKHTAVRVISYPVNRWKGNAVKLGVLQAQGAIIGYMDSDLDISPEFVLDYYRHLQSHPERDVVIGSKAVSHSEKKVSLKRAFLSAVSKMMNRVLFWLPVKDTQVGIKMFRKQVGHDIFPLVSIHGYAFDVEFLFHAHIHGYSIEERAISLKIEDKKSSIDIYSMLRILYDLFILFKKTNYVYILRKKELKTRTKIRIFFLRAIIFPSERIVGLMLRVLRNPKIRSRDTSTVR